MFRRASPFERPIWAWNAAHVANLDRKFRRASVFNQPLGLGARPVSRLWNARFAELSRSIRPLGLGTRFMSRIWYASFAELLRSISIGTWPSNPGGPSAPWSLGATGSLANLVGELCVCFHNAVHHVVHILRKYANMCSYCMATVTIAWLLLHGYCMATLYYCD